VPLYETDQQIEQEPIDLTVELAPDPSPTDAPPGSPAPREGDAETSQSAAPEIGARQLRIPEPNYTEAARSGDVRAQVEMEVTIAPSGRVKDARILRRVLLSSEDGSSTKRTVEALGYGLEEPALDAARRTLFRPARAGGKAVQSRKTLTLTFGPGG
jgi:protein TonB